jgi:hypothetical protein
LSSCIFISPTTKIYLFIHLLIELLIAQSTMCKYFIIINDFDITNINVLLLENQLLKISLENDSVERQWRLHHESWITTFKSKFFILHLQRALEQDGLQKRRSGSSVSILALSSIIVLITNFKIWLSHYQIWTFTFADFFGSPFHYGH